MTDILIVDPDPLELELLRKFCTEELNFSCRTAQSGQEALDALERTPPDLVLSEIELPDLDGFGLVRQIHQVDGSLPVALMVKAGSEYARVEVLNQGAEELFTKPLSLMNLKIKLLQMRE
jgi:DNA-binding response OmpR family regulator